MTHQMTFRGTTVAAEPGQSVAAALIAAGVTDWRTTGRGGRPRGVFCGIGICFDCLITVDGIPDQRACLVAAADGMRLGAYAEPHAVLEDAGGPGDDDA
ncbi:(2Fe-2S)-binding protein [Micromonospora sp. NPDC023737]|uniref:(2Fe-2S)-binding protein n=1 Tax=unclassified Micromonospora TaxID=2617518 RepID=UPI0033C9FA9D